MQLVKFTLLTIMVCAVAGLSFTSGNQDRTTKLEQIRQILAPQNIKPNVCAGKCEWFLAENEFKSDAYFRRRRLWIIFGWLKVDLIQVSREMQNSFSESEQFSLPDGSDSLIHVFSGYRVQRNWASGANRVQIVNRHNLGYGEYFLNSACLRNADVFSPHETDEKNGFDTKISFFPTVHLDRRWTWWSADPEAHVIWNDPIRRIDRITNPNPRKMWGIRLPDVMVMFSVAVLFWVTWFQEARITDTSAPVIRRARP
ncbi:hypothetical protein B0H17DRAFT_1140475 [Mycena rosella]|uniref:Uncharacterized protein n=1 Tax=Mycena rosella TaxID=1033263 RepID=A0AAD7D2I1_MYCRO|nr:hypothetical protein B0H17DRAFT_1140475 [Mycena rosella]